jgi:methylisocitrate lyase
MTKTRHQFRTALSSGKLLQLPGAFNPLVARAIDRAGFDGVYLSGGAFSASLGLPDIGLTTLDEVAGMARAIAAQTNLPILADADTGFGEVANVARTVEVFEQAGVAGLHLEDQVNPKRCGHLDGKELVDLPAMTQKIRAAVAAKTDADFLIMARTDARATEGVTAAVYRAKAYVDAGAEAIFPEGLMDESEFATFRAEIKVPLLANMTEFGKSPLLSKKQLENLGYNIVIYPVTTLRLAMNAVVDGLAAIKRDGGQAGLIEKMQTRTELYDMLDYESYVARDKTLAFK